MKKPLTHEKFLLDVEAFCVRHGLPDRQFGLNAANDTALLHRLRSGISPTLSRVEQVYDFMITYENGAKNYCGRSCVAEPNYTADSALPPSTESS